MINKRFLHFIFPLFFILVYSCKKEKKIPQEILSIKAPVSIERFDQDFSNLSPQNLDSLQLKYPFLFPKKYTQEFWLKKSKDTLQQEIINEIHTAFPNTNNLEKELELLYKHLIFYYPTIKVPQTVSLISEVDYKNRILLRKELLLIALDCYLGKNHHFYADISRYVAEDFESKQIVVDIANEYAKKIIPRASGRDFMAQMVLYGKRIYLLKQILPKKPLTDILSYTDEELLWNQANESKIWRYFIEKEILFSTNRNLLPRFLYPAPFSKFYMSYDTDSSDRIGQYMGYRIVSTFMENNDVSLQQLMEIDSKTIFEKSRFKPKK